MGKSMPTCLFSTADLAHAWAQNFAEACPSDMSNAVRAAASGSDAAMMSIEVGGSNRVQCLAAQQQRKPDLFQASHVKLPV